MNKIGVFILIIICSLTLRSQNIYTIAGSGLMGSGGGDGGLAINASMDKPVGIALDAVGNIYFTESSCVRKVNITGTITTIAGNPSFGGYTGDGGLATSALLSTPNGLAFDSSGNLYIADAGNAVIRKVSPSGTITTIAGAGTSTLDGILASSAKLSLLNSILIDNTGNIYLTDDCRVRKINSAGIITTIAGNGTYGFSGDGGIATSAQLFSPNALAIDASGNIFISDGNMHCIRKVNTSNIISTVAGVGGLGGYSGDGGPATSANLYGPMGLAIDPAGNLFISDNDRVIRKVNSSGNISTFSGTIVAAGFNGSGIPASTASLNFPNHIITDASGNIYFCDGNNYRVRQICVTSCLAGVDEIGNVNSNFKIYPNPTNYELNVRILNFKGVYNYVVYNSIGQMVLTGNINDAFSSINVFGLTTGMYFIELTNNKERITTKFIKHD